MVLLSSARFRSFLCCKHLQTICIIPPTTLQLVGGSSMEAWRGRHGAANGSSAPEATAWSAGDLAFWMCRKSEVLTDFFCDFMIFYVDWSYRNYRTWLFYRLCQFAACSFFYAFCVSHRSAFVTSMAPKGVPHGLPQVIACCLPSLCFVPSLGKGRSSEQRLFLRSQMEQRQVETEETWQKRWEESDEEPNLNNLNIYIYIIYNMYILGITQIWAWVKLGALKYLMKPGWSWYMAWCQTWQKSVVLWV